MKHQIKKLLLLLVIASFGISLQAQNASVSASSVLSDMHKSVSRIKNMSYNNIIYERMKDGSMMKTVMYTDLQYSPHFKVYAKNEEPRKGLQIWYDENDDKTHADVKPKTWLPSISFDIYGSTVREDQHQTLRNAGFKYFDKIIQAAEKKARAEGGYDEVFKYKGTKTWFGKTCYIIELTNPRYKITSYKTTKSETFLSVAKRLKVNDYKLWELNPSFDQVDKVPAGTSLKVPSDYAKKVTLYIEKNRSVPVYILIHDEKGKYEQYEFRDLKITYK